MLRPERGARPVEPREHWSRPWVDHLALAVALGTVLLGYSSIVEGRGWWPTVVLVTTLVGLVCAGARSLGLRWVAPSGLLAGLLAIVWIFVPQTLALGVLPTPTSARALWTMLDRAQVLIMEEAAPAAAARPVVLVLTLALLLVVVVADVLLRRGPGVLVVGVLLVAVYAVPALISGRTPATVVFLVPAAAWLVLLWSRSAEGGPPRRLTGALSGALLGTGALVVGLVLPPALPDVSAVARDWGDPPPTVFGQGINPMLQLGQNLRRGETQVAATYTTTLDSPPYLRVAILRDFTGRTWRPVEAPANVRPEGQLSMREDIPIEEKQTTIAIDQLRSTMLPVPYPATQVANLDGQWRWNRVGQTLTSTDGTSEGQLYTVTSLDVQPTAEQMRAIDESFVAPGLQDYLALPGEIPEVLARTAREVTAEATTDYDRALALQEHFQTEYRYSETAPVAGDYDGNGLQVLAEFLEERAGYCVHFASAMAVMAREVGIPSRIVVGYAPGTAAGLDETGTRLWEVTSDDLHAWPELFFEGVGWIGFEPTPSVGQTTGFAEPQVQGADPSEQGPAPEREETPQAVDEASGGDVGTTDEAPSGTRAASVVALLLLALALVPAALRWALRRRRLALEGPEPWWLELQATARDHGLPVDAADTPRGFAGRLGEVATVDRDVLEIVLRDVETARYARPGSEPTGRRGDVRALLTSIDAGSGRRDRWRARLLPRSLARAPRR